MNNQKYKYVSVLILFCILIALFFSFKEFSAGGTANIGNTDTPSPTPKEEFSYIHARSSLLENIMYENNFGGSKNEDVLQVYNLDFYYIIGNTNSTDFYFQNNVSDNIFIIKMSRLGNAVNVSNYKPEYKLSYISSHVVGHGIYLLCYSQTLNSSVVVFYDFSSLNMTEIITFENTYPLSINVDDNIIVVASITLSKLVLNTYNLNSLKLNRINTSAVIQNIQLIQISQNHITVFANSKTSFAIYKFENLSYTHIYSSQNVLSNFIINEYGYLLFLYSQNTLSTSIVLLNHEYQHVKETTTNITEKHYIVNINNANYIVSQNKNYEINFKIVSKTGDIVFDINSSENYTQLLSTTVINNSIYILANTENQTVLIEFSALTHLNKSHLIQSNNINTIKFIERNNDGNLLLFGTTNESNEIIKNHFGGIDIFASKFKIIS